MNRQRIIGALLILVLVLLALVIAYHADIDKDAVTPIATVEEHDEAVTPPCIRPFDPNVADYYTLVEAGVERNVAVSIIKWRASGKVYRIKEDVALCHGMTDSLYRLLEPYIIIGKEYQIKCASECAFATRDKAPHDTTIEYRPFMLDTVTARHLTVMGFSHRQAELIIRYRDMIGGYRSIEEFEECYAVGEEWAQRLAAYIIFPARDTLTRTQEYNDIFPIEINGADSATLRRVKGIGEKSVGPILRYRELLGGYYSAEQISELKVVTEDNFQRILPQIWCDSAKIKKICINFASPKELEVHPYLSSRMLRRIINKRELKGGWSTIEEMIEDNIFSEEEAKRIAPYLDFGTAVQVD